MTWWIISKIAFFYGVSVVVHVGFTEKYLSNVMKFLLNSEPLLEINLRDLRYIDSYTSLNMRDVLDGDWSMIWNSAISNYPVAGLIKVMDNSWSYFLSIYCQTVSYSVCANEVYK